ncbi:MAG: S9 family peptidase [Acidobacteria bacterium]|nr:S9 family peptidase [Acidobacteriota bacterium]
MMKTKRGRIVYALVLLLCSQAWRLEVAAQSLTVRDIMSEPSIAGMRPEGEKLSPDGSRVAYLWSATGKEPRDLYLVETGGDKQREPVLLVHAVDQPKESREDKTKTKDEAATGERKEERVMQRDAAQQAREQSITAVEWSPNSKRLLFSKGGDLYTINVDGSALDTPKRLTRTAAFEGGAEWLADSHHILYQSGGNLFVVDADQTSLVQLTREGGGGNTSIFGAQASDDGSRVAYVVSDSSKQRALFVPNYTGEFVTAPTVRRGWSEQRVQVVNTDGSTEQPTLAKLPAPEGASYIRGVRWTPDSTALIIDRIDRDTKRRQIYLAETRDGAATLIDEETDAKWIAPLSSIIEVSPKGDRLLFASERDGYDHLYVKPLRRDGKQASGDGDVRQLTRGKWEVDWAKWMPDGEHLIYSSTGKNTAEREFYVAGVQPESLTFPLGKNDGMNTDAQLSKDGGLMLFQHSTWNEPTDLYTVTISTIANQAPVLRRLTDTVPERFKQIKWARPEFTEFKAKDGKMVKARVYVPPQFDKRKKYPAVVFVHGAGYLQDIINGWSYYYREAMFNHILTERGYVVLEIDYRGSAGYGREWRTDVYDFLGGLDFQDHLNGIDFIVKNYAVDASRVGMYGGSYGGFTAEMAAMRAPEHVACAAALRPVADWKNYFASSPIYTTERLGFPDKNTEAYKRSSPISYADKLSRPLLILHGMVDDNVHFQDSVQLIEKLIKLGKSEYFEVMFYPNENHAFTKPESWTDEYERMLRFFDAHLRTK